MPDIPVPMIAILMPFWAPLGKSLSEPYELRRGMSRFTNRSIVNLNR